MVIEYQNKYPPTFSFWSSHFVCIIAFRFTLSALWIIELIYLPSTFQRCNSCAIGFCGGDADGGSGCYCCCCCCCYYLLMSGIVLFSRHGFTFEMAINATFYRIRKSDNDAIGKTSIRTWHSISYELLQNIYKYTTSYIVQCYVHNP